MSPGVAIGVYFAQGANGLDEGETIQSLVPGVLVCDDERQILQLIEVNLQRQGHEVHLIADHRQVLATLRSGGFEVLVIDGDFEEPSTYEIKAEAETDSQLVGVRVFILDKPSKSIQL